MEDFIWYQLPQELYLYMVHERAEFMREREIRSFDVDYHLNECLDMDSIMACHIGGYNFDLDALADHMEELMCG